MDIPTLSTARLILRAHRREDFASSLALWSDPAVTRFIGGRPQTPEEVWSRLLRYRGHWAWLGFGFWAVAERSTGAFLGEVGFMDAHRVITPSLEGIAEIGWALMPFAHGRGFATEAVRGALHWGDAHLGAQRTACIIHPDNAASLAVAAKCNYREAARTIYHGEPTIVLMR